MSKKKTNKRPGTTYEQRVKLEAEFGPSAVCGYIRNFHRSKDYLIGKCSLTGERCKREMPQDLINCSTYVKWLDRRQQTMREYEGQ